MAKVVWAPPGMHEAAQKILDSTESGICDRCGKPSVKSFALQAVAEDASVMIGYERSFCEACALKVLFDIRSTWGERTLEHPENAELKGAVERIERMKASQ